MRHDEIMDAIKRVADNFGKNYEPETAQGIFRLLLNLDGSAVKDICQYLIDNSRYLPRRGDFEDAMLKLGIRKNNATKVKVNCVWCGGTGQVTASHKQTFDEITVRCTCPAKENFSEMVPTFGEWKLRHNYTILKYGQTKENYF